MQRRENGKMVDMTLYSLTRSMEPYPRPQACPGGDPGGAGALLAGVSGI